MGKSNMFILCYILFYLLVSVKLSTSLSSNEKNFKFNVLFIFIDDLRHLCSNNINLPHIEKLAANGIAFKNAFAQQALCAPSRNSILTGRRPDALELYDFYSYWRHDVGNFTTLPQLLKENGYNTYSVGKVFHPGASSNYSDDYPYSWTRAPYHPPSEIYKDAAVCKDEMSNKLHRNLVCPVKLDEQPDKTLPDLQSLEYAINILKEAKNEPFFLAVGFHKPHIPLKFPKNYLDMVPIEKVAPPKYPLKPEKMPLVAWHPWWDVRKRDDIQKLNISFPMGTMPPEWTIKIRQSYYAASLYIDHLIGSLMRYVNTNNTIVVLTSDHGWSLGENGMWAKYSNFDVALKVPLVFSIPGVPPKIINTPVELLDIFPTLAELTDMARMPRCEIKDKSKLCYDGDSLVPLIKGKREGKEFALSQYPRPSIKPRRNSDTPRLKDIKIMGYSIRTQRYRYTEWISFNSTSFSKDWNKIYGTELYDHYTDPYESDNVYKETKYRHVKTKLSQQLRNKVENNK